MRPKYIWIILTVLTLSTISWQDDQQWNFDDQLAAFFKDQVVEIENENNLTNWDNEKQFKMFQDQARNQLWSMLGMNPRPFKSDLNARITGSVEHEYFVVEKIVFQSSPGLYVTGNLYRPKKITEKLPAILYVCGHATVEKDGYNYGAKAHYQHHPAWYARHGYVCLIIDTVQLGEIEGIHHGTFRYGRWWWLSVGYTPAGIEAWNGIRAIDYLVSRPEVDSERIGMTGRSGGGATTWWVGALDERVKVVAPVSGITDLHNHVIDGCVEGHCDCMYFVNTYRWDFPKLGALIAPRPLLIANADRDGIFPLDGVYRTYEAINQVYEKLAVPDFLALNIVGGGHNDIQEVRIHPFRWFNHFLKGTDSLIDIPAIKYMSPEDLRVLDKIPADQLNKWIDESFVAESEPLDLRLENISYSQAKHQWMEQLDSLVFRGWPSGSHQPEIILHEEMKSDEIALQLYKLSSEPHIDLPILVLTYKGADVEQGVIQVMDDSVWQRLSPILGSLFNDHALWSKTDEPRGISLFREELKKKGRIIYLPIRGAGIASYAGDESKQTHIKRRYYLIGQTLESMQTYDILQGTRAVKSLYPEITSIETTGNMAIMTIYAALYNPGYHLTLRNPGSSHRNGPYYLNILKYLDVPAAILMASQSNDIYLETYDETAFRELIRYATYREGFKLHF